MDPRSRWDLVIISADLNETSPSGEAWDAFGGLPDPYVEVTATDGLEVFEEVSPALRDVDREHVLEYCKRVLSKGDEACAVSDDDEAGQL